VALGDLFKKAKDTVIRAKDAVSGAAKTASGALSAGVQRTAKVFQSGFDKLVGRKIDAEMIDTLRDTLIGADISPGMTEDLLEKLQQDFKDRIIADKAEVLTFFKNRIKQDFPALESQPLFAPRGEPTVILIVGVNGSGKTTSIAKLAHRFKNDGISVLVAPADTFRAAAVHQLITWAERVGVDYVPANQGQDPASVAYQAIEKAVAKNYDVVIVDTAGRQDVNMNLMAELDKIKRVIKKKLPSAPHEVLLVLDGNTGQTAIRQAKNFDKTAGLTGLIITKLDGTARGGAVISMRAEVDIPVKWIGLGEKMTDLEPFDADVFVDEIFKTEE